MFDTDKTALSQLVASPAEASEMLRLFMSFPLPLAVLDARGATLLSNEATYRRFGPMSIIPASIRDTLEKGGGDCRVLMRPEGRSGTLDAWARAVRVDDLAIIVFGGELAPAQDDEMKRLQARVRTLEKMAATDFLTGAWNRAHFDQMIEIEMAISQEGQTPLSLVLLDIDRFKDVNDVHGHATGDAVLRQLVDIARSSIRASDVLFRWGGEEFAVLAASTGYRGAERLAENIRRKVAEHVFGEVGSVTVSIGVAEHLGNESPTAWFERLDRALYEAKETGRNRIVVDRRGQADRAARVTDVSVLKLTWREAYESGNPTIDTEHRELFRLANEIVALAVGEVADENRISAALDELISHVSMHFADEEAILEACQYRDLPQHRRAHEGLLRRAAHLREEWAHGRATLWAVVEFLAQEVIVRHLLAVDRAFFPLFASERDAPQPTGLR